MVAWGGFFSELMISCHMREWYILEWEASPLCFKNVVQRIFTGDFLVRSLVLHNAVRTACTSKWFRAGRIVYFTVLVYHIDGTVDPMWMLTVPPTTPRQKRTPNLASSDLGKHPRCARSNVSLLTVFEGNRIRILKGRSGAIQDFSLIPSVWKDYRDGSR